MTLKHQFHKQGLKMYALLDDLVKYIAMYSIYYTSALSLQQDRTTVVGKSVFMNG